MKTEGELKERLRTLEEAEEVLREGTEALKGHLSQLMDLLREKGRTHEKNVEEFLTEVVRTARSVGLRDLSTWEPSESLLEKFEKMVQSGKVLLQETLQAEKVQRKLKRLTKRLAAVKRAIAKTKRELKAVRSQRERRKLDELISEREFKRVRRRE